MSRIRLFAGLTSAGGARYIIGWAMKKKSRHAAGSHHDQNNPSKLGTMNSKR